jgi:hypothetical protein
MRPRTLLTLAVAMAWATAAPAVAAEPEVFTPESIVFPVVGDVTFTDTFGAPRSGERTHEGIDILSVGGVKGLPVVAAADGVVDWIGSTCCYLSIDHGGGWETWYIHLNNDTEGTDDGLGWGIADGITVGTPVAKGQLIGFVGDSGNAEEAGAHLHFEIRTDGVAINAYPYLLGAPVLTVPGRVQTWEGHFRDDDGSEHRFNIDTMFELGITKGCNPPANTEYCPDDLLTRGQVAAFLRRNLEAPTVETDYFTDDDASIFAEDIDALTAIGVGFGCTETEFCPNQPLLREEMAELLVRAYEYPAVDDDFFTDDDASPFHDAINGLRAVDVTRGCNPPDNTEYCPTSPLTRAEMATFLARALGVGA